MGCTACTAIVLQQSLAIRGTSEVSARSKVKGPQPPANSDCPGLAGISEHGLHWRYTGRLQAGAKLPGSWAEAPYTRPADLTTSFMAKLNAGPVDESVRLTARSNPRQTQPGSDRTRYWKASLGWVTIVMRRVSGSTLGRRTVRWQSCCCRQNAGLRECYRTL